MSDTDRTDPREGWMETTATVTKCVSKFNFSNLLVRNTPIIPRTLTPRYLIRFRYEVGGQSFAGKFHDSAAYEEGYTFKVSYDPLHPDKNSGGDPPFPWVLVIVCVALGLLIAWWKQRM